MSKSKEQINFYFCILVHYFWHNISSDREVAGGSQPKMSVTMQRELRTIAESLDEIAVGGVAQSADILIQRFKAIEESLKSGGSWRLSRHLEVTKDLDSLVSTEEQLAAAKEELSRLKLTDGKK